MGEQGRGWLLGRGSPKHILERCPKTTWEELPHASYKGRVTGRQRMRSWGIGTSERQEEERLQPPQGTKGLQESSPEQGPPLARCCRPGQACGPGVGLHERAAPQCSCLLSSGPRSRQPPPYKGYSAPHFPTSCLPAAAIHWDFTIWIPIAASRPGCLWVVPKGSGAPLHTCPH